MKKITVKNRLEKLKSFEAVLKRCAECGRKPK